MSSPAFLGPPQPYGKPAPLRKPPLMPARPPLRKPAGFGQHGIVQPPGGDVMKQVAYLVSLVILGLLLLSVLALE